MQPFALMIRYDGGSGSESSKTESRCRGRAQPAGPARSVWRIAECAQGSSAGADLRRSGEGRSVGTLQPTYVVYAILM